MTYYTGIMVNNPFANSNSIAFGGNGGGVGAGAGGGGGGGASSPFMGGVGIGFSIGGAIGSVYSAWASGKALDYVMQRQREINAINAKIAQFGVEAAHREGEDITAQVTHRAGQIKASQRVGYAAAGVAVDVGSAGEVQATTELMKEMDKRAVAMNALAKAWGYRQQGANIQAQGLSTIAEYNQRKSAVYDRALTNVMDSASLVADRWYKMKGG